MGPFRKTNKDSDKNVVFLLKKRLKFLYTYIDNIAFLIYTR